jgi:methyl-accepting chemotaxis protein
LADVFSESKSKRNGESEYTFNGKKLIGYFNELPVFRNWILFSSIERADIDSQLTGMRNTIFIIGIVSIIAGIIVAFIIGRSIAKPVVRVVDTLKDIVEGEGDLTRTIAVHSKDELGDLALYFNETLKKIRTLVGTIKYKINGLNHTSFELSANMGKTSTGVRQISENLDSMKNLMIKQEDRAIEAGRAVEDVKGNIDSLKKMIEDQTDSVNMSSSAIEEMTANIHSVTQTLAENSKNVSELAEASENGKNGLQLVAQEIQGIAHDSEGLRRSSR